MQSRHNTIEDLLKDESFINYCRRSNGQDIAFWEKYKTDNPGKNELIEEAVQEYRLLFTALANADAEEQLQQLKKKIEGGEQAPIVLLTPHTHRRGFFSRFKYALGVAACLVAVAAYLLWLQPRRLFDQDTRISYVCKQGERKSFQFPDGTQVILNAGSEILLNHHYGQNTREVFLAGEAFFEVQQNKQVPFVVHTAGMDVKALGTAFNVRSYAGENRTETVLIRGLVEVTLIKENNRKLLLHPHEKISWKEKQLSARPGPASASKAGADKALIQPVKKLDDGQVKELAWVDNSLAFDDEPFEEIAAQLNRWYNVHIRFGSEEVKQYHFTATFKKEKIEQVLDILKASKKFNYRIDGQTIVIY